jgi:hypothetical protein
MEGLHTRQELARHEALQVLLDENIRKEDFIEYDEYSEGAEGPFGIDTLVHAVWEDDVNVLVSVISNEYIYAIYYMVSSELLVELHLW